MPAMCPASWFWVSRAVLQQLGSGEHSQLGPEWIWREPAFPASVTVPGCLVGRLFPSIVVFQLPPASMQITYLRDREAKEERREGEPQVGFRAE